MASFKHLSNPNESLQQMLERALRGVRDYPNGPPTKERRCIVAYALNDLADRLMQECDFRSRPGQSLRRSGKVINDPRVELLTDGTGGELEELGVLYQLAPNGSSVRFGLSYYPGEDLGDLDARGGAMAWRTRLQTLLADLEADGFTLAPDSPDALSVDEDRWGIGWLAWRRYVPEAVPADEVLLRDFRRMLAAYDSVRA